jgi:signal transduction histidine kinase
VVALPLDRATIEIGGRTVAPARPIKLPHRWDSHQAPDDGSARYELTLPPMAGNEPYALFINRIGNQAEVLVAGRPVARLGVLSDPSTDGAKGPVWIDIPSGLMDPRKSTPLEIRITAQAGRWGGLSQVLFGPASALRPLYERNFAWRQGASIVIVLSLTLMGLMAGGLWWRQRDISYGLLALTALFGVIRMGDRLLVHPPLPWPLWGAVTASAYIIHLMLMARFAMLTAGVDASWMRTGFWVTIVLCCTGAVVSFFSGHTLVWTAALGFLAIPGLAVLAVVVLKAFQTHERNAMLLCAAGLIVVLAGFRDYLVVRLPESGSSSFSLVPHAVFIFVLFMGWIVVDRYSQQVRQYRELNATLEQRIAERERELGRTHAQLQQKAQEQAAMEERQRIMRDIHDGVGAHLVSLLSLVRRGETDHAHLQDQLNAALDELRVAVDSLQPVHGDLVTVLATMRYRLQPRLQAAGLEVIWNVDPLPLMENLSPHMVLQVQRLLLEAFTNVLRHSNASQIEILARALRNPPRMLLVVADNGVGFDASLDRAQGVGMASMRARAATIGAALRVAAAPGQGTRIELELQLPEGLEVVESDQVSIGVAAGSSGSGGRPEST